MRRDARWLGTWERASAAYLGHLRRELARAGRHDARSRVATCCAARGETAGSARGSRAKRTERCLFLGAHFFFVSRRRLTRLSLSPSVDSSFAPNILAATTFQVARNCEYLQPVQRPRFDNRTPRAAPGERHCLARATFVRSASSPEPQPRWLFVTPRRVSPRSGRSRPRPRPARSARPRCARPRRRRSPSRVS